MLQAHLRAYQSCTLTKGGSSGGDATLLYALVHVEEIKGGLRRQNDDRMRVALFEEQRPQRRFTAARAAFLAWAHQISKVYKADILYKARPLAPENVRSRPTLLDHSASHSERLFLPHSGPSRPRNQTTASGGLQPVRSSAERPESEHISDGNVWPNRNSRLECPRAASRTSPLEVVNSR